MRRQLIRTGAVLLLLVWVTSCSSSDQGTSTSAAERSRTVVPANGASAVEVAQGFVDAYGTFDTERALTYVTDEVVAARWGSPELLRLELALLEAQAYEETITGCERRGETGSWIRCDYDFHGIRSHEIGLGPYSDNNWDFAVEDGTIVTLANEIAYETNGFSKQVWEPFAKWVAAKYPDDVPRMYENPGAFRLSEESVRLWDQRSREYAQQHASSPATTPSG